MANVSKVLTNGVRKAARKGFRLITPEMRVRAEIAKAIRGRAGAHFKLDSLTVSMASRQTWDFLARGVRPNYVRVGHVRMPFGGVALEISGTYNTILKKLVGYSELVISRLRG